MTVEVSPNPEAIEAMARDLQRAYEATADDPADMRPWDHEDLTDEDRDAYREMAASALAAALPLLRARWTREYGGRALEQIVDLVVREFPPSPEREAILRLARGEGVRP